MLFVLTHARADLENTLTVIKTQLLQRSVQWMASDLVTE